MTEDYARTEDFYRAVAAVLLAGDIQARVVSNDEAHWVRVDLIDGSEVLWTNTQDLWGYSVLSPQGEISAVAWETLPWDVDVETAARMIAMRDYDSPAEWPASPLGGSA